MNFRPSPKRRPWSRPLADFVTGAMNPVLAKNGFGEADIILNWDEIAGERLAAVSEPVKVQWPGRGPKTAPDAPAQPATLVLRVEGAFALEVQHLAPVLIERINGHLGWRCVGRIVMRQAPLERAVRKPAPSPPDPEAARAAAAMVDGVVDAGLRDALARLGARALSNSRAKP